MAMDMRSMVAALAQLPESARRTMMRERLDQFASLSDTDRAGAMRQMMEALGTLQRDDVKKLVASRTEALCELPAPARMALMQTHLGLLAQAGPERAKAEIAHQGDLPHALADRPAGGAGDDEGHGRAGRRPVAT